MKFAVIEVGSTNTKGYLYEDEKVTYLNVRTIEFKTNYTKNKELDKDDINSLLNYIQYIKKETDNIYVYGTSIFRNIDSSEIETFSTNFKQESGYDFNVVSADDENEYTVYGVINKIDYTGELAVMIGGGGSTEISVINNKKIVEKLNQSFGVLDILNKYPDLQYDKPTASFDEVLTYTNSLLNLPEKKVDILVLAGGDYLKFYEGLNYPMEKNTIYDDVNQPYMISSNIMDKYDLDFHYKVSLDDVRNNDQDNSKWWDGTRGMRFCVKSIVDALDIKYIIPTRISMVYGIIETIKDKLK